MLEDFISNNDLCVFNDDSKTYMHPAPGTFSFSNGQSRCENNHFQAILSKVNPSDIPRSTIWILPNLTGLCFKHYTQIK